MQEDADAPDWSRKEPKAFWRGRDSRPERLSLVRMSKMNFPLLDAQMTNYFFFRDEEKELGRTPHVSFKDFFKVISLSC